MNNINKPRRLRSLSQYFVKSLKFYDLKNERVSRTVFILILILSFSGAFITSEGFFPVIVNIAITTAIYLASTIYLAAFIKDLKAEEYSLDDCFNNIIKNIPKILVSSVTYIITTAFIVGIMTIPNIIEVIVLVATIPVIVVYIMFLFNTCLIVDKRTGVIDSYTESKKMTDGNKASIFGKLLGFNLLIVIPVSIIWMLAFASGNPLIENFILSFIAAIINLMQQRLTALMYFDLQYNSLALSPDSNSA